MHALDPLTRSAGRPRCEATHLAILAAAYEILVRDGLAAFSIESVAQHAGVARTTIYRWWPSKGMLAIEAFLNGMQTQLARSLTDCPADDFRAMMQSIGRTMSGPAGRVVASIVAEAQADPAARQSFYENYAQRLRARSAPLVQAGIDRGAFRPDLDVSAFLDAAIGGLYYRLLFGLPIGPDWVAGFAETLLHGALAPSG